jgi:hypothetical protein
MPGQREPQMPLPKAEPKSNNPVNRFLNALRYCVCF